MTRVHSIVSDATYRLKRLPVRAKCFLIFAAILSFYLYGSIFLSLTKNHLTEESYLQTDKCPACFGHSICTDLKDGLVKMKGWSRLKFLDFVNLKNVHLGHHEGLDKPVILKKLAHNAEWQNIDNKICTDANRPLGCDVARVLDKMKTTNSIQREGLQPKHLKDLNYMFSCPTFNLIDRIYRYYKEKVYPERRDVMFRDKLQIYATAMVNPEPLILQTFPKNEGWPFPEYFGACGRFIVVSNEGEPLNNFYNSPWHKRADLAYQIMKIAERLTNHGKPYGLYWTDLSYENLVVDDAGRVTVVDVENVVVVDRTAIRKVKPKGYNTLLESNFDDCGGKNCLVFSTEDLCTHIESDHNYFAACRNLLSKYANEGDLGMPDGLLHDMPNYARDDHDLEHQLNECVHPTSAEGRIKAKQKILEALDVLRNIRDSKDVAEGERI